MYEVIYDEMVDASPALTSTMAMAMRAATGDGNDGVGRAAPPFAPEGVVKTACSTGMTAVAGDGNPPP